MLVVGYIDETQLEEMKFIYKTFIVEKRIQQLAIISRGD